jgi:hypothetical protein
MSFVVASLAGDMDEAIYVEKPEGFEAREDQVC